MVTNTWLQRGRRAAALSAAALAISLASPATSRAAPPITIGFGMAESGVLAPAGKSAILAMQIWADDVNAKGGLLGRQVKLDFYDDQSNGATVPGLYTKLLDVDKVDFIVSGYGTNLTAPAMPVAIAHKRLFLGLFALAVNSEFHYPMYFSMLPVGPDPKVAFSDPFFKVIMSAKPKPKTLALAGEDAEFPIHALQGATATAKKLGLKVVYNRTYPPNTVDMTPIINAINATSPDAVFIAAYPGTSAGMLRAATEVGLKTRFFGGGLVGLQYTSFKEQFGAKLNGVIDYDFWIPAPTMNFPGITDFLKKYQAKAKSAGVDPLGWYLPPFAYAELQVLADAIKATKSLDQVKLADYIRAHEFKTIVGDVRFGKDGEWSKPRVLEVQWQNVKGNSLDEIKDTKLETILEPSVYRTGKVIDPYYSVKK